MSDRLRSRTSLQTAVVWEVLRTVLAERGGAVDVLDAGGGTGGFAVPLAELGCTVTVVDPSPDSLAALERRAAEAEVSARVRALQGDAAGLLDVVTPASYDLVLCHSVLEVVDDPATALAGLARALRPGGVVSVLAANRIAAVVHRVVAGRVTEALAVLDDPVGRSGPADPLARRFTVDELLGLVAGAGLRPGPVHGVRVFADLVPGNLLDGDDPAAADALVELDQRVAELPAYRDIATQLHLLASPAG